ncbi:MAG: hypothetical protein B7Z37_18570 [Verrucomicrobia bacterium 12-59-8]|nr:MAG: hypothetical protein B7Z37_18570 [Verrucomicrobia bacterium 12-59-8]
MTKVEWRRAKGRIVERGVTGVFIRERFGHGLRFQIPAKAGTTKRALAGFEVWGDVELPERAKARTTYEEVVRCEAEGRQPGRWCYWGKAVDDGPNYEPHTECADHFAGAPRDALWQFLFSTG